MPPPSPSLRTKGAIALLIVASLAALVLIFVFDPATHSFYPACPLHTLTGLECPTCGALRAAHLLLHGDIRAAFALNPFLFFAVPCVALLALPRKTPLPRWMPWAALAALFLWFLWRIA
ncbi:MAG: DUF2752 domain-containing protein [Kiritimatiellae bacterium]|nr:DUF2752 domain-containing protein [Kiritimatiellia bacterium]